MPALLPALSATAGLMRSDTPRGADQEARMSPPRAPTCPMCSGEGVLLGPMGALNWFRCRHCGWTFSRPRRQRRHPPTLNSTSTEKSP